MLSTQNVKIESENKGMTYGNQYARINGITVEAPGYDTKGGNDLILKLHLETPPVGGNFVGFPLNPNIPDGPKHEGKIASVKMSQYAYRDGAFPDGTPINRNNDILKALLILAKALGKDQELNQIQASTIEEFVPLASKVLSGPQWLNWCIGGREYMNNKGYTAYDLFLPRGAAGRYAFEQMTASPSKLLALDITNPKHFIPMDKPAEVTSFPGAPVATGGFPAPGAAPAGFQGFNQPATNHAAPGGFFQTPAQKPAQQVQTPSQQPATHAPAPTTVPQYAQQQFVPPAQQEFFQPATVNDNAQFAIPVQDQAPF